MREFKPPQELLGEKHLLLASQLPVLHWMFQGNIPSTHPITNARWSKWAGLITQQARMGKPYFLGILEEIMNWSEGRDFGTVPEKETCAREAPPYELPENKRGYGSWESVDTTAAFWLLHSNVCHSFLPMMGLGVGKVLGGHTSRPADPKQAKGYSILYMTSAQTEKLREGEGMGGICYSTVFAFQSILTDGN